MNPKTHPDRGVKLAHLLLFAACALCAGCNSLDSPLANIPIFRSGNDGRVYNAQTGKYEWSQDATPRPASASRPAAPAPATPPPKDDGRPFDPQKGKFLDPEPGR